MQHYCTYLRAELGKLRNGGDVVDFLKVAEQNAVHLGLPLDARQIAAMMATQAKVDAFVSQLDDEALIVLTTACSRWRANGIAAMLSSGQRVNEIYAPVDVILLGAAEPRLASVFGELGWSLQEIAIDPRVLADGAYRNHGSRDEVAFPWCLAVQVSVPFGPYRIVDGMHRAIQLVRGGANSIPLCVILP